MLWSIGHMDRQRDTAPVALALVVADTPDAPITGVHDAGDELGFTVVLNAVADALLEDGRPSPLELAVVLSGRDGTVHQVMDDGSLRGWRRDYGDLSVPSQL
ncbi:hypothetical protein [Microbacterium sp.]|uniref:hypothetical protein n=1 Tax=Microbacterium sp. TaxID=51671 RepID=UPI00261FB402|nr:hypothetical protein [uncultured Microbacterium sp.]